MRKKLWMQTASVPNAMYLPQTSSRNTACLIYLIMTITQWVLQTRDFFLARTSDKCIFINSFGKCCSLFCWDLIILWGIFSAFSKKHFYYWSIFLTFLIITWWFERENASNNIYLYKHFFFACKIKTLLKYDPAWKTHFLAWTNDGLFNFSVSTILSGHQ